MATDAAGLVYNKQEGSGMAQIFGPSGVVDDLRKATLNQAAADKAARDEAAKTITPKAPKVQKPAEFGQPWLVDNAYVSEAVKLFTNAGAKKIAGGVDITTDPEYLNSANVIKTAIEGSTQQQKLFDQQRTAVVNDPKKFDTEASLAAMEEWRQIPLMQRLSTPMPDPIYRKEEEAPIDLFKPFDAVKIGVIETTIWNEDRISGETKRAPNKKGLMAQIDAIATSNPKLYAEGLKPQPDTGQPLWNSREEMKQFYFDWKIGQGDYSTIELIKSEASNGTYGDYGEEDILLSTDEWKTAFLAGEENAAGYLTGPAEEGVKTNNGYILDGVSKVGSFDLNDPKQLETASRYIMRVLLESGEFSLGSSGGTGVDAAAFANNYRIATPDQKKQMLKSIFKQDGDVVSVFRYTGVGKDLVIDDPVSAGKKKKQPDNKEMLIIPQMLTDEELEAYYLKVLKNKKKLYNKDFAVNAAGNVRNTGEPSKTSNPGTATTVGSTAPKDRTFTNADVDAALKDPKNKGYSRQEIIDYYTSQGFKLK
jgi:hypothetical protein